MKITNEILEKLFIFNLQIVLTARCRSSLSRPDIVGCRREVAKQVKKTASVSETKKKEELLMLLDDPKIPTARQNPRRPHYSHKRKLFYMSYHLSSLSKLSY
jgi:hypothetical protein